MINVDYVREYEKEATLPPREPGGDYACQVPLKFGGSIPLVNVLTGEQCPNSNVTESINFPGNPALTDIRAEAGITYEEILEKCVWMTPTEATVLKMAQIKRRRGWQDRLRKEVVVKKNRKLQPYAEAFEVLAFLIGQFQPYFKQGKFTHLKHALGYRTCYNHLAEDLGWEERGKHLKKRLGRVITNLVHLGFIEKQIISHVYTDKKLWFNVTFLRVVPEKLFPFLDPTGYKTRKALMENSGGDSLFVMMNHRTKLSATKSDRMRISHLFGRQTLGRMDTTKLYGDKAFSPDLSENNFLKAGDRNSVVKGKVVNAINCNSNYALSLRKLLSVNSIHSENMKKDRRSLLNSLFVLKAVGDQGMRLRDAAMAWNTRSHSSILPANNNPPAPLPEHRKKLIVAAVAAFHGPGCAAEAEKSLVGYDEFSVGAKAVLYTKPTTRLRAAAYFPTGSTRVPINPDNAQPALLKIFNTAWSTRFQNDVSSSFEAKYGITYSNNDYYKPGHRRFGQCDRPTDLVVKSKQRPMGIFKAPMMTRKFEKLFEKFTHELAFMLDPDAFFHTKDYSYRKLKTIPHSRAGAGKDGKRGKKGRDGKLRTDPSYENHFWDWKPWYSADLRLVRCARYIKKHESDFMMLRAFFGHHLEAYTARPEFALQFYKWHRKGLFSSALLSELASASVWKDMWGTSKSDWLLIYMRTPKKFVWAWRERYILAYNDCWDLKNCERELFASSSPARINCTPNYVGDASKLMEDFGRCEGYFFTRIPQFKILPIEFCPFKKWNEGSASDWKVDCDEDIDADPTPYMRDPQYDSMPLLVGEEEFAKLRLQRSRGRACGMLGDHTIYTTQFIPYEYEHEIVEL